MKTTARILTSNRRSSANRIHLTLATLGLALLTGATAARPHDDDTQPRWELELPSPVCDSVEVPAGNQESSHVYAFGVQIYRWSGTNWVFVAPEATLFADRGYESQVGTHSAGPTWEGNDGSKVTGVRVAGCAPYRGAIPWLLLKGTSTSRRGRFAQVSYIQRVNTIGGSAPTEAGAYIGDEARVPYTAEYNYFYRAGRN